MRPPMALAFAVVGFVALLVCGLGVSSLIADQDVIAGRGLGQLPGILGSVVATGGFAGLLWASLRSPRPSFWASVWAAAAAFLGYLVGVSIGALLQGTDPAVIVGTVGRVATSWFGAVIVLAALIAGWGGIALVRTRSRRPRWPWERDEDE